MTKRTTGEDMEPISSETQSRPPDEILERDQELHAQRVVVFRDVIAAWTET